MKTPAIASTERPLSWVRIRHARAKLIMGEAPRADAAGIVWHGQPCRAANFGRGCDT